MRIKIEIGQDDLKKLVVDHVRQRTGAIDLEPSEVKIETKPTQNYRAEWEVAAFRATVDVVRD